MMQGGNIANGEGEREGGTDRIFRRRRAFGPEQKDFLSARTVSQSYGSPVITPPSSTKAGIYDGTRPSPACHQ